MIVKAVVGLNVLLLAVITTVGTLLGLIVAVSLFPIVVMLSFVAYQGGAILHDQRRHRPRGRSRLHLVPNRLDRLEPH